MFFLSILDYNFISSSEKRETADRENWKNKAEAEEKDSRRIFSFWKIWFIKRGGKNRRDRQSKRISRKKELNKLRATRPWFNLARRREKGRSWWSLQDLSTNSNCEEGWYKLKPKIIESRRRRQRGRNRRQNVKIFKINLNYWPFSGDGIDYHFIDRSDFDAEITNDSFLEYGMNKAGFLYGTLMTEVEKILDTGKTPLLCPPPQALNKIRNKKFKAFVVFLKARKSVVKKF